MRSPWGKHLHNLRLAVQNADAKAVIFGVVV